MKIIATDFDGTLNHNGIDNKKLNSISAWRGAGNLFGIVTGRGTDSIYEVIKDTGVNYDFIICNNGAVICDNELKILSESRCDGKVAKPFIKSLLNWGCPFANIDKDISVMVVNDGFKCKDGDFNFKTMPVIDYFNQINTMLSTEEEATEIVKKIEENYGDVLNPLQNGECIDIVPKGVNKATGIYSLLEIVGATYNNVITVGDNYNDKDMIMEFRSYAMDNAVDYIKKIADDITLGITELIEKEI